MKLYIESYQSKIEELEEFEANWSIMGHELEKVKSSNQKLESDIDKVKSLFKKKQTEWKLKEQELSNQANMNNAKQNVLEDKIKDLETFLVTNRTSSGSNDKRKGHRKNYTNKIEAKNNRADLILLKDESWKLNKNSKIKYLLKGMPSGSVRASDDPEDALISFSELSTKVPDKPKPGSLKKKVNPYKIEYFKNSHDLSENSQWV